MRSNLRFLDTRKWEGPADKRSANPFRDFERCLYCGQEFRKGALVRGLYLNGFPYEAHIGCKKKPSPIS
jgi:hypothetical protein